MDNLRAQMSLAASAFIDDALYRCERDLSVFDDRVVAVEMNIRLRAWVLSDRDIARRICQTKVGCEGYDIDGIIFRFVRAPIEPTMVTQDGRRILM